MPFHDVGSICYYSFDNLDENKVLNATFTRRGGISPPPWASLNMGGLRGDDPERVYANRVTAFNSVGRQPESVFDVWQVHGNSVICTKAPRAYGKPHQKADAIFTDHPEITLFMRFADCVPILLFDPRKKVIGLVHAGWQGTVNKLVSEALDAISAQYGCAHGDIMAAIGPSICPDHYSVGEEVVNKVKSEFGKDAETLINEREGRYHFNLWEANRLLLESKGIKDIFVSNICTACNLNDWYSHRGEAGHTGRFGVIMALPG
ncbi:MAG: peptidoglycan editing factor PgeF [Anaerolineales bacterium]|nr:peptidoglycan editing factor PgeF [Anaerolineales bacterium]